MSSVAPPPNACYCGRACNTTIVVCNGCHRGVHTCCLGLTTAAALSLTSCMCGKCRSSPYVSIVVGCPLVFTSTCRVHNAHSRIPHDNVTIPLNAPRTVTPPTLGCDVCGACCAQRFIECGQCQPRGHMDCIQNLGGGQWRGCLNPKQSSTGIEYLGDDYAHICDPPALDGTLDSLSEFASLDLPSTQVPTSSS